MWYEWKHVFFSFLLLWEWPGVSVSEKALFSVLKRHSFFISWSMLSWFLIYSVIQSIKFYSFIYLYRIFSFLFRYILDSILSNISLRKPPKVLIKVDYKSILKSIYFKTQRFCSLTIFLICSYLVLVSLSSVLWFHCVTWYVFIYC